MTDTEDLRWQAVENCDVRAAGCFVFGRHATGVYCSPLCRIRPVRRGDVTFFDTPEAAREAGFQSCGECYPDQAGWLAGASRWM
ncbi:MAG: Ada metal-binding domain-containing protein [Gemmobacter sp.]